LLQNITTMDWQNSAAKLFSDDLQQNREAQKGFSYNNGVLLYEGCCLVLSAKSSWTPIWFSSIPPLKNLYDCSKFWYGMINSIQQFLREYVRNPRIGFLRENTFIKK
jgi:hypothetical protein